MLMRALFGEGVAKTISWHSIRIGFACALLQFLLLEAIVVAETRGDDRAAQLAQRERTCPLRIFNPLPPGVLLAVAHLQP